MRQRNHARYLALALMLCCWAAGVAAGAEPDSLGFEQYYKCPSDFDAVRLGDTITADACLAACRRQARAAGCWWLDGSGGFPRECRVCRTMEPERMVWPNDWGLITRRLIVGLPRRPAG